MLNLKGNANVKILIYGKHSSSQLLPAMRVLNVNKSSNSKGATISTPIELLFQILLCQDVNFWTICVVLLGW
jgi:hypothetical protein